MSCVRTFAGRARYCGGRRAAQLHSLHARVVIDHQRNQWLNDLGGVRVEIMRYAHIQLGLVLHARQFNAFVNGSDR